MEKNILIKAQDSLAEYLIKIAAEETASATDIAETAKALASLINANAYVARLVG